MRYEFDISDLEFRLIRDFVSENYGLKIKQGRRDFLRMKLYPRVLSLGLESFADYYYYIKFSEGRRVEQEKMMSLISNGETYFFRELAQLEILKDELLPSMRQLYRSEDSGSITILSAGCSTGEETYSIATMGLESGQFLREGGLKVYGGDIRESAIRHARKGLYRDRSFRMTDTVRKQRYFSKDGSTFRVKSHVKRLTKFLSLNIIDPRCWDGYETVDIVSCRNVLIYFSEKNIKTAIDNFSSMLKPGGYLMLGHSESLSGVVCDFEPMRYPSAIVYQKKES